MWLGEWEHGEMAGCGEAGLRGWGSGSMEKWQTVIRQG